MITIRVESSQKPISSQDLFFPSHICAESPDLVYEATVNWRDFDIGWGLQYRPKPDGTLDFVRFCSYKDAIRSLLR